MIYLLGLFIRWVTGALVPALLLLVVGAVVGGLVWLLFLRRRRRAVVTMWLVLGMATLALGGWRTREVWRDFTQPHFRNFRTYVADPIPTEVRGLAMATAAPAMFHDGALVRFEAPEPLVRKLIDQSLRGAKTLAVVAEMKRQSGRDPADRSAVAGPDGRSYVRVDVDQFPRDGPDAFRWARVHVEQSARQGFGEAYVLLLEGEWGKFQSVITWNPAVSNVVVRQYLERRRSPDSTDRTPGAPRR
jgi:hypothetical protein